MTRYRYRKDKEGFAIPSGVLYRLACCDCGLVHDIVLVSDDGNDIGFAACRNERATAARRRGIFEIWAAVQDSYRAGLATGIERAAKVCEGIGTPESLRCAAAIRALLK